LPSGRIRPNHPARLILSESRLAVKIGPYYNVGLTPKEWIS
jgi:hypothetical protein